MHDDELLSTPALARASGAREDQLRYWIDKGILVPAKVAWGQGTPHGLAPESIIEATQYADLTAAGLSGRQLRRIADIQRTALAGLPADERIVRRHELYIETICTLAAIFGKSDSFDEWHARQQDQLQKMRAARGPARRRGRSQDRRYRDLLRLVLSAEKAKHDTATTPLAG